MARPAGVKKNSPTRFELLGWPPLARNASLPVYFLFVTSRIHPLSFPRLSLVLCRTRMVLQPAGLGNGAPKRQPPVRRSHRSLLSSPGSALSTQFFVRILSTSNLTISGNAIIAISELNSQQPPPLAARLPGWRRFLGSQRPARRFLLQLPRQPETASSPCPNSFLDHSPVKHRCIELLGRKYNKAEALTLLSRISAGSTTQPGSARCHIPASILCLTSRELPSPAKATRAAQVVQKSVPAKQMKECQKSYFRRCS